MSVVANYRSVGHSLHHSVEVERTGSLARWKFTEALQPLPNISRRRSQNEDVVDKPASIIDTLIVTTFEGITSQVGDEGGTQFHKRLPPDLEAVSVLF